VGYYVTIFKNTEGMFYQFKGKFHLELFGRFF
jgi:hypothetical protein